MPHPGAPRAKVLHPVDAMPHPVDAIELTSIYYLTGQSREELIYDREKLLEVYDQTKDNPKDPVRTSRGILGPAAEIIGPITPPAGKPEQSSTPISHE